MVTYLQCRICRYGYEYAGPRLKSDPLIFCKHCGKTTRANVFNLLHRGSAIFEPLPPEEKTAAIEQNESVPTKPQVEVIPRPGRDIQEIPVLTEQEELRFWGHVRIKEDSDCWPWKGGVDSRGSGVFCMRGLRYTASRVAYRLAHGDPGKLPVKRSCGQVGCCNPEHLYLAH